MVGRRRAWHAIIACGQHTRSNDVGCGMPSSPSGSTHGRTSSEVACHHCLWAAHSVERHRSWHAIIAFGKHTRSNDVERGMQSSPFAAHTVERRRAWHAIIALGQHTRSDGVKRGMPSSPQGSTHGRTTSDEAYGHRRWAAQTAGQRRAWHAIIAFGQHTRSDGVGHCMPS